jgi:hypothetical protein
MSGVAFSLVPFFWRSKRKELAAGLPPANGKQRTTALNNIQQRKPSPTTLKCRFPEKPLYLP